MVNNRNSRLLWRRQQRFATASLANQIARAIDRLDELLPRVVELPEELQYELLLRPENMNLIQ